jgi:hypothetical protein
MPNRTDESHALDQTRVLEAGNHEMYRRYVAGDYVGALILADHALVWNWNDKLARAIQSACLCQIQSAP